MNMINTIFPFYVVFISILTLLESENIFDDGVFRGLVYFTIGIALGLGACVLFCAGILWVIIGILSFFGVTSVGAWTVGFSWTAVKAVMMIMSLITFLTK